MAGNARTNRTSQRARALFLEELERRGVVTDAARAAGVARRTAYEWRAADEVFAKEWDNALDVAIDAAETEAWRRGIEGVDEPVIGRVARDQDGVITYVKKYSDGLLTTILKANRPEKYRERTDVQHSGAIQVEFVNDWRQADA